MFALSGIMTKTRIQKEEKIKEAPTFGRPTHFGRTTLEARSYDASMTSSYRRVAIFDGHPTGFGRPTRRTSDMERTSDMKIFATTPSTEPMSKQPEVRHDS